MANRAWSLRAISSSKAIAAFTGHFAKHENVAVLTRTELLRPFCTLVDLCMTALTRGNKLLFFGNGGSAADAQHLAAELVVRFRHRRPSLSALALTTDTSVLTALGNDYGFEYIFERQIDALGKAGDVAIGLSTSGQSTNVIKGLQRAKKRGLKTVGMTGQNGVGLWRVADLLLKVPSEDTAHIQEMHITIGHALCQALENP